MRSPKAPQEPRGEALRIIEPIPDFPGGVVGFRASGTVTREDDALDDEAAATSWITS